jgi:hypothetical protein
MDLSLRWGDESYAISASTWSSVSLKVAMIAW